MTDVEFQDFVTGLKEEAKIKSPYHPRPLQAKIHADPNRFRLAVAHRRFGKSYLCAAEIMQRGLMLKRKNMTLAPPRYAYIAPTIEGALDLGWEPMMRFLADWEHEAHRSKKTIRFRSAVNRDMWVTVMFEGAQKIDYLRGRYMDGVVLDEYSEMPGGVWKAVVYPMLADYKGWACIIGTPKGRNAFWRLYNDALQDNSWGVHYYPVSETGYVDEDELKLQREQLGDNLYRQEFMCEWTAALEGAVYGQLMSEASKQGRITSVPHDPSLPVYTGWDLGISDPTSIWFAQVSGGQVRIIDFWEKAECSLEEAAEVVRTRKGSTDRPYFYHTHFFPHDARQREFISGTSRHQTIIQLFRGYGNVKVLENWKIEEGMDVARALLPMCLFDANKCQDGIDMLSIYRYARDEVLGTFTKPIHDFTSHAADAFRYLAIGLPRMSRVVRLGEEDYDVTPLNVDTPIGELMRHARAKSYYAGQRHDRRPVY